MPDEHDILTRHLSEALTTVNRWATPLDGHDFLSHDGDIAIDSDPDVDGWTPILTTHDPALAPLLTVLLRGGAVKHLQQTLQTAITFLGEHGDDRDPAVRLGAKTADEVLTIAASDPTVPTPAPNLRFERFLSDDRPAMPDLDFRVSQADRDAIAENLTERFGQPTS